MNFNLSRRNFFKLCSIVGGSLAVGKGAHVGLEKARAGIKAEGKRSFRRLGAITTAGAVLSYGTTATGNSPECFMDSKLIILMSFNPAEMIHGSLATYHFKKAKERGARILVIDPRYSDTAAQAAMPGQNLSSRKILIRGRYPVLCGRTRLCAARK